MTFSNFFDFLGDLEWLDVIIGAVAIFVFAWAWYGPLFGNAWRSATGREMSTPDPMTFVKGFLKFLLFGIGLTFFMPAVHVWFGNAATFETLLVTSFALAFLVVGMTLFSRVVWEGGSTTLWGIDFGFWFFATFIFSYLVLDLLA